MKVQPAPVPRRIPWLRAVGAGMVAFLASWAVCVVATILIIRAIPPAGPEPADAEKGVGYAMTAVFLLYLGAALSFFGAVVVGFMVSVWVACRHVLRHPAETLS